jgi:hypothetical protein
MCVCLSVLAIYIIIINKVHLSRHARCACLHAAHSAAVTRHETKTFYSQHSYNRKDKKQEKKEMQNICIV